MHSLITEHWNEISPLCKQHNFPAKTTLLRQGEISTHIFIVKSGALRLFYLDGDGKDISFQFFFENQLVSSFESFYLEKESKFSIESIEDCEVFSIDRDTFISISENIPGIKNLITEFTCNRFIDYANIFLSYLKNTPEKRYMELIKRNPDIMNRIPHYYIASYLGITPVSLSRIRKRTSKEELYD